MKVRHVLAAATAIALASTQVASAQSALAPRDLFAFHSAFWLNLHEFLYARARAGMGIDPTDRRPAIMNALADTLGIQSLSASERDAWDRAIRFYMQTVARNNLIFDSSAVALSNRLAAMESSPDLRASGLSRETVDVLEGAAAGYRKVWWKRHDSQNRRWIESVTPLLERYGVDISQRMAAAFKTRWPSQPIRADVTVYAIWAGAYTTVEPSRITISSMIPGNQNVYALETLAHESMHTMDTVVSSGFADAARAANKNVTYELTHAVIFYTAGAEVQRAIPSHQPFGYAFGIWNGGLGRYEPLLVKWWKPYLDGAITLEAAERGIVGEL